MSIPTFDAAQSMDAEELVKLFVTHVRLERRRLKLTQAQFAGSCSVSLRTYKRFELGECDSLLVLIKVAQRFGRGAGLSSLLPAQVVTPSRMDRALQSIRKKLDERVVQGEAILDE